MHIFDPFIWVYLNNKFNYSPYSHLEFRVEANQCDYKPRGLGGYYGFTWPCKIYQEIILFSVKLYSLLLV